MTATPVPESQRLRWTLSLLWLLLISMPSAMHALGLQWRSLAYVAMPACTGASLGDGSFMRGLETHLQESSPVTLATRAMAVEAGWLVGLRESARVHAGRDGWLFLVDSTWPNADVVDQATERRRRFLAQLVTRMEQLDIRLLAVVVPDKERLYPELCYPDRELPRSKQRIYAAILRDLTEAGVAWVDGAQVLGQAKLDNKYGPLFYKLDTHWNGSGQWCMAAAVVERLRELGWTERMGPTLRIDPLQHKSEFIGDLARMHGVRENGWLAEQIAEYWEASGGALPGSEVYEEKQPTAQIALCGTSFSDVGFQWAMLCMLQRRIDLDGVRVAKGAMAGLMDLLHRIEAKELQPRVVIWEFAERSLSEPPWLQPPELR